MELAGEATDPSAVRPLVKGVFGRVLTLDDVTAALDGAGIEHQVVGRHEVGAHGADLIRFMAVYAKVMDENHWDIEDSPDFYILAGRSWDELSAIDLEEWLEDMNAGSRRFGGEGEIKGLLGIAEGGVTPFARVNDRAGQVSFQSYGGGGEGKVALEAFDELCVVVMEAEDVDRAVAAFEKHMGPQG